MPACHAPRRPVAARLALLLAALLAVAVGSAAPAQAHAGLLSSSPADGSLVQRTAEIVLRFGESPAQVGTSLTVTDPAGQRLPTGEPRVVGSTVTASFGTEQAGTYDVAWRVVAQDGHPVDGRFSFSVAGEGATASPAPAAAAAAGQDGWVGRHSGHLLGAWLVIALSGGYLALDLWRRRRAAPPVEQP